MSRARAAAAPVANRAPPRSLYAEPSTLRWIRANVPDYHASAVIVSPDAGGAKRYVRARARGGPC